ncbi:Ribonuclease H [Spathaspora sp. JA1]|nr:Ribonuclease H [Spathaspora sp. JA1]
MPYYAVANGRNKGVYTSWEECKAQVNGHSGSQFKKFDSPQGASDYMNKNSSSSTSSSSYGRSSYSSSSYSSPSYSSSSYSSPSYSTPSYSSSSYSSSSYSKPSSQKKTSNEAIYVDGACRGNGKDSSPASGYGVYYGPNDSRNAAVPLSKVDGPSTKATNQRAELHASIHAMENINRDLSNNKASRPSEIHSDSKYVVESMNNWSNNWKDNGWKTTTNKDVANADLFKRAVSLKEDISSKYTEKGWEPLQFTHVKGHAGIEGNEQADKLANLGADEMHRGK